MQLASQRPNPPPVPPRPSRQVVAEALKRTTRPPCPTRQAPPPPNTKPWRYQDHEKAPVPQVGRTVVYESGKEQQTNVEQSRCSSEPRSPNELQRSLTSRRCSNDENGINIAGNDVVEKTEKTNGEGSCPNRATSERNEAENHQQPIRRRSNGNLRSDRENFSSQLNETDTENSIKANDDDVSLTHKETDCYSDRTCLRERNKAGDAINEKFNVLNDESLKITDQEDKRLLDDDANENIAKLVEVEITGNHNHDGRSYQRPSSSFGKEDYFKGEPAGKRQSLTPTKIQEKTQANVNNDGDKVIGNSCADEEMTSDDAAATEEEEATTTNASGSTMTISSDDCATVVVIDETERKIAIIEDNDNIQHQDWLEAGIRYSSTKITLPGDDPVDTEFTRHNDKNHNADDEEYDDKRRLCDRIDHASIRERIAMSSLQGLPPLPRSLSGFNLSEGRRETAEPPPPPARSSSKTQKNVKSTQPSSSRPSPPGRQLTTLDTQLAILRKEMFGLRQLDLSLLSQLWSLNESIQEFRQLLQEQEDRAPSPSPSSEEGDDNSYGNHPPPPPRRPAPLLHHHRPPRPPRPLRPPASDESPSSEEYGAV